MIDRFFRALAQLAYGGFTRRDRLERQAAARAFAAMEARREREFARLVLTGRWPS